MERRRKQKSDRSTQDTYCRIIVTNHQRNLSLNPASVRKLVRFFLNQKRINCRFLSVYFVGKRKISSLHGQFFNDFSPTDCMTFPMDREFLGECVICPKVAQETNPKDPYLETSHYLIHCLLHLIGYDDIDKREKLKMRKEEYRLLEIARKEKCILEP